MTQRRVAVGALCFALLLSTSQASHPAPLAHAAALQQATASQLEALSGEYTDPNEPDTPISFYTQNGKLILESERMVPTTLSENSPTEFGIPDTKMTLKFTLDSAGRGATVFSAKEPDVVFKRTGDPVHHSFHDYQRTEAMIPMRDGIKLHTVILKPLRHHNPTSAPNPAHPLWLRPDQPRIIFRRASRTRARRLHLRLRRHPRTLQERRRIRNEPPRGRPPESQSHR